MFRVIFAVSSTPSTSTTHSKSGCIVLARYCGYFERSRGSDRTRREMGGHTGAGHFAARWLGLWLPPSRPPAGIDVHFTSSSAPAIQMRGSM